MTTTPAYDAAVRALDLADQLRARAVAICCKAPFHKCIYEETWARVEFDGDTATLLHCEATSSYGDGAELQEYSVDFPAYLLFISGEELAAWQAEQKALYDKTQAEKRNQFSEQQKAERRARFEELKREFGGDA